MLVQFKMPRCIDGVDYKVGVHEMPDKFKTHPHFLALVQNNIAVIKQETVVKVKPAPTMEAIAEKVIEAVKPQEEKPKKASKKGAKSKKE